MTIAEKLSVPQHKLFPLLEGQATSIADKAGQMEYIVGNGTHNQLLRQYGMTAGSTLDSEESIIVQFTVELRVAHIAGMVQLHATVATGQALFMPVGISYIHQITVVYLLATSFTQFIVLFAFDMAHFCRRDGEL